MGADPGGGCESSQATAASALLWAATLLLPRGVSRNRYRREFAAEMYGQPGARQLAYALGVWAHIWALRTVLVRGTDVLRPPFACRTNLHHHWERFANDTGVRFQTCARCGRERQSPLANSLFLPMHVGGMDH
jgi:hypothetical protein